MLYIEYDWKVYGFIMSLALVVILGYFVYIKPSKSSVLKPNKRDELIETIKSNQLAYFKAGISCGMAKAVNFRYTGKPSEFEEVFKLCIDEIGVFNDIKNK